MPSRTGAWVLFLTILAVITAWPPQTGQSLALKVVHLAVDPDNSLPFLPEQLDFGLSDDPQAVGLRDMLVRRYDDALASGPLMRTRLRLKNATDPFDPATERQGLLLLTAIVAFAVLRTK
jgi:hypothetical protein